MRIAIVFGNDGSDPRIIRTSRSLVKMGHDVHFIGWDRRSEPPRNIDLGGGQLHVLRYSRPLSRSSLWAQIRFSLFTIQQLSRLRPDVVCAANEENAVRVLPFRKLLYKRLVCDVIDSQRDVFSNRILPVRLLWSFISELAHISSDTLIATDHTRFQRFGRHKCKTKVIGNYPEDPGEGLSKQFPAGKITIYVAGVLTENRGLRQILGAIKDLPDVSITAAGWPTDAFSSETFIRHPQVHYLGHVSLAKSLELAANSDAVLTFYAPNCRNNILASPTKLYEAMSVGRPVIMNREAQVAKWVEEKSLGFTCAYEDRDGLRNIVQSLASYRSQLPNFASRVRHLFQTAHSWEKMEAVLEEIYGVEFVETNRNVGRQAA